MTRCCICGPRLWVCDSVFWPFWRRVGGQCQAPWTRSSWSDLDHRVSLPFLPHLSYSSLFLLCPLSSVQALPLHSCLPLLSPPLFPSQGTPALHQEVVPSDHLLPAVCLPPVSAVQREMFQLRAVLHSSCWSHVAIEHFGVARAAEELHFQTLY